MDTFLNLTPQDTHAIWLSIKVACGATLIATPFGFAVAYLLVFSRVPGKSLIEGLVNCPLSCRPWLSAICSCSSSVSPAFSDHSCSIIDIRIIFTLSGAVLASAVVGFPLLVRAIRIGMEGIDRNCLRRPGLWAQAGGIPW